MKEANDNPIRIAIIVSHPIQHFVPFYRESTRHAQLRIKVFFGSRIGVDAYTDKDMGVQIVWDMDLLGGYDHEFLFGAEQVRDTDFWSLNNPYIGVRLDEYRQDVVMVYGYSQLTQLRTLYWRRRNRIPVLMQSDSELLRKRPWHSRMAKQLILPSILRQVSAFLTIGDHNEAYYANYGARKKSSFVHR